MTVTSNGVIVSLALLTSPITDCQLHRRKLPADMVPQLPKESRTLKLSVSEAAALNDVRLAHLPVTVQCFRHGASPERIQSAERGGV